MLRGVARAMSASKIGGNPSWQQSMLRVKDPKKSLDFYQNQLGMTLIDKYDFGKDKGDFSLFFLASFKAGETYSLTPGSAEAHKYLWSTDKVTLELTHNHGSEAEEAFKYHPGNQEGDGFGHIAFAVEDVAAAKAELLAKGVTFRPTKMKTIAFAYDPDSYWVELVGREEAQQGTPPFTLSQTMLRIKDPAKSIPFYTQLMGLKLVAERHYGPEKGDFSLFFLCNPQDLPENQDLPDPSTPEAMAFVKSDLYPNAVSVLELTHNHGTELDDSVYSNGNTEPRRGFGHIGFLVDDVGDFCNALEGEGVAFQKKPDEGGIKGIAFAKDPDGYWIEIIQRGIAGSF